LLSVKFSRAIIAVLVVVLIAALLVPMAGCKKDTVTGKTLRVAFGAAPDAIDVVGYKMLQILESKGIKTEAIFVDGGPKSGQALLANQADVATCSLEDIVNAGLMAFALQRPRNLYAMVGRKGMTQVEDIVGGKLGAADPGSIANVIAEQIFLKHGVNRDQLTWMQIGGNSARAGALLAGNADAVFIYGSNYLRLQREGYPTLTTMQAEFPGLSDDMWVTTKEWLPKNEAMALEICKAQLQAAQWFREDKAGWLALALEKVEGLEEADALELYDVMYEMDMFPLNGLMSVESLTTTAAFLSAAGTIPDVPITDWSNLKYMDQAREELGIQ
jgi:ABC-type nitrate/sulfonate/bicarbonate transport system substrate-binding protein